MKHAVKNPIMRYHGGKFRLAPWVMSFFPEHATYVEPFGGGAGVLLQKPRSQSEVYNDLDRDIVNVFKVLQSVKTSEELIIRLRFTPYARHEFEQSYEETTDPIEQARRTLIRAHMGFGSAGATKHKTGFRIDSAREYGTSAHIWARYPNIVTQFTDRLQAVIIENKPAIEVIKNHDRPDTLFYVDPPYLHATRCMDGSTQYYNHEMTDEDHFQLLKLLEHLEGFVVLSGYDHELYNDSLKGWQKHAVRSRISAKRGTAVRTEVIWLNPACSEYQPQKTLFG